MASLLVVHGVASPGFVVGMNGVVALTGAATLPSGPRSSPLARCRDSDARRAVGPLLWLLGSAC